MSSSAIIHAPIFRYLQASLVSIDDESPPK